VVIVKLKKIAYWVLGSVALGLVMLSVALSFLDWNQYRSTLSNLASQQMDMRVELAGNVTVALFPRPSVSAEAVRISPLTPSSDDVIATADKISMRLGVMSFLKGRITIQSLMLEGLSAALDETASGTWKFRGWPDTKGENTTIDLSRLDIENGQLSFTSLDGAMRQVDALNVNLTGSLPMGPLTWKSSFMLEGQKVESNGQLKPVVVRDEVSVKTDIFIDGGVLKASGRIAKDGDITARLLFEGQELGAVSYAFSVAYGKGADVGFVPNLPFLLDLQLDVDGHIAHVVSRQMVLGDTQGRIDLTVAQQASLNHITGGLSLGVIDIDEWERAQRPASEGLVPLSHSTGSKNFPVTGAVDITIEGVRMNGGLGQRIDAVLAFKQDGPEITSLQALLPGAASLSLAGNMGYDQGIGSLNLEVGNIADLARWVGVDLPQVIPEGRLSTASAKATLDYRGGVWSVTGVDGFLDTSKIKGEMSGKNGNLVPDQVKLAVDTLDLDIFTEKRDISGPPIVRVPDNLNIGFDISADAVHGFGGNLGTVRFVGAAEPGKLDIDYLSFEDAEGSLRIEGLLANEGDDVALELAAVFNNWDMHISRYYVPDLQAYLLAAKTENLSGTASAAGVFSKMRLGLEATAQDQEISLSGEIGFPQNRLTFASLQGGLKHNDLAGVARVAGVGDFKQLPAQLTYALSKPGPGEPLEIKVGGDLAGGKVQAEILEQERVERVAVSFDHENVGLLEKLLGNPLVLLNAKEGVRAELTFTRKNGGWQVTFPNIKNGDMALTGAVLVSEDNQLSGDVSLSEIVFSKEVVRQNGAAYNPGFGRELLSLADYAGSIRLSLDNVTLGGQEVSAPQASLDIGDGVIRFALGDGASLNNKAVLLDFDATLEGSLPFNLKANFEAMELAALLVSGGVKNVITSEVSGEFSLQGSLLEDGGIIPTLSGAGNLEGSAGQLHFLSVISLVDQMQTVQNGRSFLASIGTMLRQGKTPFSKLESSFSIDGGVMLIEAMEAAGGWGSFSLDGQVNLADRYLALKGDLSLADPPDTPVIPVQYEGTFDGPSVNWSSRVFERFVIAGIERRMRTTLFNDMEERQNQSGQVAQNPGMAVFSRAFGLLTRLKAEQAAKKRADAAARKKAEEDEVIKTPTSPETEEHRP